MHQGISVNLRRRSQQESRAFMLGQPERFVGASELIFNV